MYSNDQPSVKAEPGSQLANGEVAQVKSEPDQLGASPSAQSEEDLYEDAGDLDFAGTVQGLYLARIPKFLWECWSKLDDDEEIRLGTVRVEGGKDDAKRVSY